MKYTKIACAMAAFAVLLISCGANPAGPWFDRSDEDTQFVLTLGTEENESFFQVAKLEYYVYVSEAWQGTWEVDSRNTLKITITEKWDGLDDSGYTPENKWVDHQAIWIWEFDKSGDTLTVTPSADFSGGQPFTLTESESIVHFRSVMDS